MLTKQTERQKTLGHEEPVVQIAWRENRVRLSLRAKADALAAISAATMLKLPKRVGERASREDIEVACLGPDEWMILCSDKDAEQIAANLAQISEKVPHSLTDISEREMTVNISGAKAMELLSIGVPRELEIFEVGEVRRTIMQDIQIILWRDGENSVRLDVWRSFAGHIYSLLELGRRELQAEAELSLA